MTSTYTTESPLEQQEGQLLDMETTDTLLLIFMCVVAPTIAIFGIAGNVLSIGVLLKQGLATSSNILIFSLAVNDMLYLICYNSVAKIIYTIYGEESFPFSEPVSLFLFVMYQICIVIDYGSGYTSLTLPMLITIERLVAVFLPLKFSKIVTPKRTWVATGAVMLFWYSNFIYSAFWLKFSFRFDSERNESVGYVERSALYQHDLQAVYTIEELWTYGSMRIPPAFTCIGCLAIGIKIKLVSIRRKTMTMNAQETSMIRMTKMLLSICFLYTVTCAPMSFRLLMPWLTTYLLTDDGPTNFSKVFYIVMNTVACLNSSWNFFIYIWLNKNFRNTYKSLFVDCCNGKSRRKKASDMMMT